MLTWHASIVLVLVSIFVLLEIKFLILLKIVVALQHVWRCLVADHIQWLLKVMENYLTRFLKPCDLNFNDVSNTFLVFFDILDAFVIFDHTWDSKIQTAEHNSFLYVLHKGKDIRIDFKCAHINDVSVDESISIALPCITEDLVVELGCALINFTAFCHIINDIFLKDIHASHLLIHLWQVLHILCCILNHWWRQWPLFPKLFIILHSDVDLILFWIYFAQIVFKEIVETDVDVPVVIVLKKVWDQPVSYLCIKYEVANDVVLNDQGRCIFTEIMENFHHLMWLHYLFESMLKWIHSFQINKETLVGVVYLYQLHASVLG